MAEIHDVKPVVEHVSQSPTVDNDDDHDDKEKFGLHEVTVEGSEALKAAIEKEPPQKWHRRSLQLYACVGVAFLVSTIQGYDGSLMGNMLVMPAFQKEFGASIVGIKAGYISAMITIGGASALPFVGPAIDTWGRRVGMAIGCFLVSAGAIIEGTSGISGSLGQYLAGRFLIGFGNSIAASAAPIYVVELAHPAYRGPLTGLYNTLWNVGGILAAATLRAGQNYEGNKAWLIPTWVQLLMPGIVLCAVFFLPESPRWLYSRGHTEKASAIIAKYHGLDNPDSVYLSLQLKEYAAGLKTDGADKRWWDYRSLFRDRASRYRVMCNLMVAVWSQWCGVGFTGYFMPAFLKTAGVTDPITILNINLGTSFVGVFVSMTGASLVERIGRRRLFYRILLIIAFWWVIITIAAAIYSETGSKGAGYAAILFVNIFGVTYAFGITPLQSLYPVEVLSYEQRAKGMAFSGLILNAAIMVNQFGMPVAIQVLDWKLYFIFIAWCLVEAATVFLFMVETKGRTLEELDEIFEAPNPRKASTQKKRVMLDGTSNVLNVEAVS
ncbi:uncharacterized protein N7496_006538 [Penicillium cataractarum]|uniref:Major facilitator superfamily (MFS) profile domain-containing protein n=1 Tax=Penicillium cataractarum TaxID=2100454 RepID=A0A9W9S1V3_9EURO|nr:uncharacterized protein N7496_006538 [Penicillium cataractarum]KAJ5370446.1 hypothetical protein N7496_006538 [Penicillium cataractarum]